MVWAGGFFMARFMWKPSAKASRENLGSVEKVGVRLGSEGGGLAAA